MSKRCSASWGILMKGRRKSMAESMNLSTRPKKQNKLKRTKTKVNKKRKKRRILSLNNQKQKPKLSKANNSKPKNHKYLHSSLKI